MDMRTWGRDEKRREAGFALIVALLTLLLLTFLGLTLATTTSTELQIANNYRWSQQAYYNAEAGLELAKRFLRGQTVWSVIVPPARAAAPTLTTLPTPWTLARADQYGGVSRNWENVQCDQTGIIGAGAGGEGYGVVLDFATFTGPMQNVSSFLGQNISGSFTVWVRRPVVPRSDGWLMDYAQDDKLVVTAEGTAPSYGAGASNGTLFALQNRAVRVLETEVRKIDPNDCENLSGQAGNGPTGSGFDPCSKVDPRGVPGATGEPAAVQNQN